MTTLSLLFSCCNFRIPILVLAGKYRFEDICFSTSSCAFSPNLFDILLLFRNISITRLIQPLHLQILLFNKNTDSCLFSCQWHASFVCFGLNALGNARGVVNITTLCEICWFHIKPYLSQNVAPVNFYAEPVSETVFKTGSVSLTDWSTMANLLFGMYGDLVD